MTKLFHYEFQDLFNDDGYVHSGYLMATSEEDALNIVSAEKKVEKQYIKISEKKLIEIN